MKTDGIIAAGVEAEYSLPGEWPSGKATDFEPCLRSPGDGSTSANGKVVEIISPRVATGIDWAFAPDWLTIEEACFLSGYDRGYLLQILDAQGLDLNDAGLIEKMSLWEFQEALALVLHWND